MVTEMLLHQMNVQILLYFFKMKIHKTILMNQRILQLNLGNRKQCSAPIIDTAKYPTFNPIVGMAYNE
jgi:hypothetical protein